MNDSKDHKAAATVIMPQPCPFCGCVVLNIGEGSTFRWRRVECSNCGTLGPEARVQTIGQGTKEQWEADGRDAAIAEWNKRHNDRHEGCER